MKIAFFHELHFGGAKRVIFEYGKILKNEHYLEIYYVAGGKESEFENVFNREHFYRYNSPEYKGGNFLIKIYKDFLEPIKLYFVHRKIARDIDMENFDFVFVHLSQFTHAPFILRFLKTPSVYFCHEPLRTVYDPVVSISEKLPLFKKEYEKLSRLIKRLIDSSNIHHADLVLSNSNYSQKNIRKAYKINAPICYLGVDQEIFKPDRRKKEFDLVFVGEKTSMEGFDTFEKILKYFNNKLSYNVVSAGKKKNISDKELVDIYNKSRVLTVLGRDDPFSLLPWEGMASGAVPVVVKEGGLVEAVINNSTGFVVERDILMLSKVIRKLIKDEDLCKSIINNGREEVLDKYTWAKSSSRLIEIVKSKLAI